VRRVLAARHQHTGNARLAASGEFTQSQLRTNPLPTYPGRPPRSLLSSVAGIAILAAVVVANAQPRRVQVGTLSCSVSAGIGLIIASQRNVNCNFQPDNGPPEAYTGTMTIVGVDVGFTTGSAIVWGVFTDTNRFAGMLTGTYVGATAQATAVAGVGANALVGGSNHSVALQPLSVQGQVGLNAAGGIGALDLHYAQ
jgi:Protein of unknown function (DUF992)